MTLSSLIYSKISVFWRLTRFKFYGLKYYLVLKESHLDLQLWSRPTIYFPEKLAIGKNVAINDNFWVDASGGVEIGNNVLIGPDVKIITVNHRFDRINVPIRSQGQILKKVVVEDDVWIAAGAILLPGARIGRGAIVAAGAVVADSIKPYSVVGGIPAKEIKKRDIERLR